MKEAATAAGMTRQGIYWRCGISPDFAQAVTAARELGRDERTFRLWLRHPFRGKRPPTGKGHEVDLDAGQVQADLVDVARQVDPARLMRSDPIDDYRLLVDDVTLGASRARAPRPGAAELLQGDGRAQQPAAVQPACQSAAQVAGMADLKPTAQAAAGEPLARHGRAGHSQYRVEQGQDQRGEQQSQSQAAAGDRQGQHERLRRECGDQQQQRHAPARQSD